MNNYKLLLQYYHACFNLVDCFHYNSNVTRTQYERVLGDVNGKVISITHAGIKDNRQRKRFSDEGLILGFIGNEAPYKGLPMLEDLVKNLNIDLHVWGGRKLEKGKIHFRGIFTRENINNVYNEMDILVVPSIWKETFSLVALEALSYGVPVLVSNNVGIQDVVREYDERFVYRTKDDLYKLLALLVEDKMMLVQYNLRILERPWEYDINSHAQDIINKIYK